MIRKEIGDREGEAMLSNRNVHEALSHLFASIGRSENMRIFLREHA